MADVRFGIIGIGGMGGAHGKNIIEGKVPGATLGAVCDRDEEQFDKFPDAAHFTDALEMYASGTIDAVIIATPHFSHTPLSIAAFEAGLHVMVEKPLGVTTGDCQKTIAAYEARPNKDQVFGVMFNQRTNPTYIKLKQMIDNGELGAIKRVNWTITDWFRTEIYYQSGGWRATWKGEGGGVLVNQCPHQLDLFQWLFGLPVRVRAHCTFGRDHEIEVEDNVTAYMEFENGGTGVFIASTGEAPGTNRLEIACDRGKVVIDRSTRAREDFRFLRTEQHVSEFSKSTDQRFGQPDLWDAEILAPDGGEQHLGILKNFADAITKGEPLMASGVEGIRGVELCNSMLYSAFTDSTVTLPVDPEAYAAEIQQRIDNSTFQKKVVKTSDDLDGSF